MRAGRILAFPLLLLLCLPGCGYLFGDKGVFRDTADDYQEARELPPMQLPEGVESDSMVDIYPVPDIESEPQLGSTDKVPRPAPLVSGSADQLVRIQTLGEDTWALVGIAPGQLWPQLRSFLAAANIDIARMDARAGIIESPYLELQEIDRPARFRFRVERGVQRGNSELHVLQMYQRSGADWPEQSDDFELEAELLRGIAQYIANSADTAPVSMMAEQSISAGGKVAIREDDEGNFIELELPFDRAWASLARSLEVSGFEITDRNRSAGQYYARYVGEEEEEGSGWFGWLGGGNDDESPAVGVPLLIRMQSIGPERMHIRLAPENDAQALAEDQLEALLVLVKGNIS